MSAQNPAPPLNPNWNPEPLLVTIEQAARLLAVSPRTIRYLIKRKRLVGRKIGSLVRIPMTSVHTFLRCDHASPSPERKRETK